ncbi:MAG: hypothetical protein JWM05_961 [Acidimicrobiales bacterium]|nr:hypothetical protein [Acidimicrobiales bacterium]
MALTLAGTTAGTAAPPTGAGPTTTAPPAPEVRMVPASIDRSGATDVTLPLRDFLGSVPDGAVAQLARGATYRVEGTLKLRGRRDLTLDGNGATITATGPQSVPRSHIWLEGGTNLAVRNLTIHGANPAGGTADAAYVGAQEHIHGIQIAGVQGAEVDHVTITDVYGDFVYVGRAEDRSPSADVWIHDSTFARNGRQGIAVTDARHVVIERNRLDDMRRSTIDLEPNTRSSAVQDVHVLDNQVGRGRLRFIAAHGGGPVDDVVIARNVLRGQALTVDVKPPDQDRRAHFYVVDNTSDTASGRAPLKLVRIDGLVVRGNTQPVRDRGVGIELTQACGVFVFGNRFSADGPQVQGASQPDCGTPPAPALPPTPAHPGREIAAPPAPTSTTTATTRRTASTTPRTTADPAGHPRRPHATGRSWPWVLVTVALVTLAAAAITGARRRAQRGRVEDDTSASSSAKRDS